MNTAVMAFFVHNVLATLILGVVFMKRSDRSLKNFGMALLLNAISFAIWSYGIFQTESLLPCVTLGAMFFLVSLVFFLHASFPTVQSKTSWMLTILGIVVVGLIFYVGHIDPATAFISPQGFFFFNLQPMVQMLYVFALMLAALPAITMVASKLKSPYSKLIRYGFIAEVAGGIVLITISSTAANNENALYIVGWIIGVVYLALWTTMLFSKKAWEQVA